MTILKHQGKSLTKELDISIIRQILYTDCLKRLEQDGYLPGEVAICEVNGYSVFLLSTGDLLVFRRESKGWLQKNSEITTKYLISAKEFNCFVLGELKSQNSLESSKALFLTHLFVKSELASVLRDCLERLEQDDYLPGEVAICEANGYSVFLLSTGDLLVYRRENKGWLQKNSKITTKHLVSAKELSCFVLRELGKSQNSPKPSKALFLPHSLFNYGIKVLDLTGHFSLALTLTQIILGILLTMLMSFKPTLLDAVPSLKEPSLTEFEQSNINRP